MKATHCLLCGEHLDGVTADEAGLDLCQRCYRREHAPKAMGSDALQPSTLIAVLVGLASAALFYGLGPLSLLHDTAVNHLFCGHGWIPYTCVALFFIAAWSMLLKTPMLRREAAAFDLQLLPELIDARVGQEEAKKILDRIARLSRKQRSLLAVSRIRQALLRLNQLGTAEKLDDLLRYRAETDEAAVESSYSTPKFIIWAIPVLGFVGTVLGISNGVQSFSTLIQNASDLDGLRQSLKGVTYGLGQAFETTMIALCMSMVLMFLLSWSQRREDRLLSAIDDYCMEHLLYKVTVPTAAASTEPMRMLLARLDEVVDALHAASHHLNGSAADGKPAARRAAATVDTPA